MIQNYTDSIELYWDIYTLFYSPNLYSLFESVLSYPLLSLSLFDILLPQILLYLSSVGLLDAVSNLKSESLGQVIRLTWETPFSLDITGVDPDIWYRVDTTVGDIHLSMCSSCWVVTIPEFNFTMGDYNGTSTRVVYEFRVTPINNAGNGTTSTPVNGYFSGCELIFNVKNCKWENLNCELLFHCTKVI